MKTLEDYQNKEKHLIRYVTYMIYKCEENLKKYETEELKAKRDAYKDILFKLTYEKPQKQ